MGVKINSIYWTHGYFDGVILFDAPDDETATAALLTLAGQGNVHTTTAGAFNSSEFEKETELLGKLAGVAAQEHSHVALHEAQFLQCRRTRHRCDGGDSIQHFRNASNAAEDLETIGSGIR